MARSKRRSAAGAVGAALAALSWYTWRIETRWLRTVRLTLPVPSLPPAFDGYRIVHVSDLHLGIPLTQRFFPRVVQAVLREQPDLVALTGDVATAGYDGVSQARAEFARLDAADGLYFVPGNHDYYAGVDAVEAALMRSGVTPLRNAHTVVSRGTDRIVIAGIDDVILSVPDLNQALAGVPDDACVILLAHEPDFARIATAEPRVVLQLSGHTHGGQIRVPGLGAVMLPHLGHLYPAGAYRVGNMGLYVTTGIGTGKFVMRFNCRPEIAVITLVRGPFPASNGRDAVWRPDPSSWPVVGGLRPVV
ncbi:MAG: metallophosphoesterase [Anaerolineae bacterium]|nr:metallophosphoesterase [Anaerolineae bacterium]